MPVLSPPSFAAAAVDAGEEEMYAETDLLLGFSQGLPPAVAHYQSIPPSPPPIEPMVQWFTDPPPSGGHAIECNLVLDSTTVTEYDLGGEGDLFKAAEPIIEEPVLAIIDPVAAAALSMISVAGDGIIAGAGDVITIAETIKVADMESIQTENLQDVIFKCKKELLAKSAIGEAFPPPPELLLEADPSAGLAEGPAFAAANIRPNFLDFQALDLGDVFGMRRAFSEGDIQIIGGHCSPGTGGGAGVVGCLFQRQLTISDPKSDERKEKLSRYRTKKSKRNFGRKINYACRKALADSQPRVRGRFARTEDAEAQRMPS